MNTSNSPLLSDFYERFHGERQKVGTVSLHERFAFIRSEVGTNKDVIELGCRYGDILELVRAGNRLTGVDIDRAALDRCAARTGAAVAVGNLNERLSFNDASFDIVIITEVLEHLPYPSITLGEAARLLRPGGKIVGSVPNAVRLRNRIRFMFTGFVETDRSHLQHFGADTLAAQLEHYFQGVKVLEVGGRFTWASRKLFANMLLFAGTKN